MICMDLLGKSTAGFVKKRTVFVLGHNMVNRLGDSTCSECVTTPIKTGLSLWGYHISHVLRYISHVIAHI